MESMHAKIWSKGDGKVGFSGTPQNLPKMDIIEEYLLGGPIFEEKYKCYTILESSHDGPLSDDAKSSQKWSGKLIPGVAR